MATENFAKRPSNWSCEYSGTVEAANADVVPFGVTFSVAPQAVLVNVNESDARYIAQAHTITTTGFTLYLYDETAGAAETVDKTISWVALYKP
jgi:hypothetical protein